MCREHGKKSSRMGVHGKSRGQTPRGLEGGTKRRVINADWKCVLSVELTRNAHIVELGVKECTEMIIKF